MKFKDYYDIMGVSRDATQDEIKRAYRRLARKYHPDVSKESDAETRFKEVGEAYEVLKDPEKRAAYDQLGKDWKAGQEFRPPPGWDRGFEFSGGGFASGGRFSDFFETLFGRQGFGHAAEGGRGFRMKGEDQHIRIPVSVEEAFRGCTRGLKLQTPEQDKSGQLKLRSRSLNVKIPKGVTDAQRIRLAGQGGMGFGGGPRGDLYLVVELQPHKLYRPDGRDLYLDLPITPWEAALGRTVQVPTLAGSVDLKIPRGSQSGRKLRLKGRGLPGVPPGDQYVVLRIVAPPADTPEAEAIYEKMAKIMPLNPRTELGQR